MPGIKGLKKTPEHVAKIAAALRGKPKSAAHRLALSKPKSEATKLALSKVARDPAVQAKRRATMMERHGVEFSQQLAHNNPWRVEYWIGKGLTAEEAQTHVSTLQKANTSKRKSAGSIWRIDHWTKKGFTEEEAQLQISKLQTANANRSSCTVSGGGTRFLDQLGEKIGLPIQREVTLFERFLVDGCIPEKRVVIEYYGSFWHMHRSLFGPEDVNRVTGWKAESKWAEDQGRVKYLEAAGYKVFVVWDNEDPQVAMEQIAAQLL